MSTRFVVEGEWTGYHADQRQIVHRTVHKASEKRLQEWLRANHSILYTDGTRLLLSHRPCKPRERVQIKNGYGSLIRDCVYHNVSSVDALPSDKS